MINFISEVPIAPITPIREMNVDASANIDTFSRVFGEAMDNAVSRATALEDTASDMSSKFAEGEGDIHAVMIAQEKANIGLRYFVTMKNRLLDAYKELMNTPV